MPYRVRERNCTQSDGTSGSYVVEKQLDDDSWEQDSCHTTKQKAELARIIKENETSDE